MKTNDREKLYVYICEAGNMEVESVHKYMTSYWKLIKFPHINFEILHML